MALLWRLVMSWHGDDPAIDLSRRSRKHRGACAVGAIGGMLIVDIGELTAPLTCLYSFMVTGSRVAWHGGGERRISSSGEKCRRGERPASSFCSKEAK